MPSAAPTSKTKLLNLPLEPGVRECAAELAAAHQDLESFSYSISHDFRAPLRHIRGYVEILQAAAGPTLDKISREHLQTIAESAAQMDQMMDGLLELFRLGRTEMSSQPVSLSAIVKEARQELRSEITGRTIDWKIGVLRDVRGDPVMLRKVMVNLISNAIKFTRTRSPATIEIGADSAGRETILFVRDNGVGFDMKCAARLFGVFQRFHGAREFSGVGVGLAQVRRIIQRHGGLTWAEAKPGGGATFYFSIPDLPEEDA